MTSQLLRSCASMEEALVTEALLKDGGFDASVSNFHHGTNDWGSIAAFGGAHVRIPESQYEDAKQYICDMADSAGERLAEVFGAPDEAPLRTRRFRAFTMLFFFFGGGFFFVLPAVWIISKLPAGWFPESSVHTEPFFSYSPVPAGSSHFDADTLPTILILIGITVFTLFEIYDLRKSRQEEIPE